MENKFKGKKVLIFDLDDTLTKSKSYMLDEHANILVNISNIYKIGIISGCSKQQFEVQLSNLLNHKNLKDLILMPVSGAEMFVVENKKMINLYSNSLNEKQKDIIYKSWNNACNKLDFAIEPSKKEYGNIMEDRGSQITFSMLGQKAPHNLKKEWDKDFSKRKKIMNLMKNDLFEFEIRAGGTTSIDVSQKGLDKSFGIKKYIEKFEYRKNQILFFGDAIFPGGNDFSVKEMGIDCIKVDCIKDTYKELKNIINSNEQASLQTIYKTDFKGKQV